MIKISELTPKGANLQNSDLLEVSESTADGYSSKSITGAEIITAAQSGLQPTLVSGTNIKTINSTSLLGSGDVAVQPTLVSGTNIKTVNGNSVLGSGDLTISGGILGVHSLLQVPNSSFSYFAGLSGSAPSTFGTSINALTLYPFIPARTINYNSLSINVATAVASSSTRILIYADSSSLPNSKIYESVNIDTSTTGKKTILASGTFTAGTIYWIGTHANQNVTLTAIPQTGVFPICSLVINGAPVAAWQYAVTFGSAPLTLNQAVRNNYNGAIAIIQITP